MGISGYGHFCLFRYKGISGVRHRCWAAVGVIPGVQWGCDQGFVQALTPTLANHGLVELCQAGTGLSLFIVLLYSVERKFQKPKTKLGIIF